MTAPQHTSRVGIIDIGSNSIRLVVYDGLKRAPVPLYNEKVMCQLGKGLAATGRLNEGGVALAESGIRRFIAMAHNMQVASLHVMATAAVRDAENGPAFAQKIEREHGIKVDIISGDREARLGAYGICSSIHAPRGVTGDLGGGSMELVRLSGAELGAHTTLPIGALRLVDETRGNKAALRRCIAHAFEGMEWLHDEQTPEFYAIGGSFRAIAKLHMTLTGYPLRILHQYTVPAQEFADFAERLSVMPEERIEKLPGIPAKRAPSIAPAAMILSYVIKHIAPERIVFSASGIREGYLYEKLPPELRVQDALLASCTDMVNRSRPYSRYAEELMAWMEPLLEMRETASERRLRLAFCLLSDIAHHIHPEYRAEWAMQRVLQSSFIGLSHRERVQLSMALYHRYQYKVKDGLPLWESIPARERQWARLVGTGGNLAYHLSGGIDGTLPGIGLVLEKKQVGVRFGPRTEALMGEAIARRISGVNEAWHKWVD